MSQKPNPLSASEPWNLVADGYAETTMQFLKKGLGEAVWREKEILALDYLKERLPSTPTELTSDAWLGTGQR